VARSFVVRLVKFAAGFAAGYVLGARAGREKYDQIVSTVDRMRNRQGTTGAESGGMGSPTSTPAASDASSEPVAAIEAADEVAAIEAADEPVAAIVAAEEPVLVVEPADEPIPADLTDTDSEAVAAVADTPPRPKRRRSPATVTAPSVTADQVPET